MIESEALSKQYKESNKEHLARRQARRLRQIKTEDDSLDIEQDQAKDANGPPIYARLKTGEKISLRKLNRLKKDQDASF